MKAQFKTYLNRNDEDIPVVVYYGASTDEVFIDAVVDVQGSDFPTTEAENQELRDECQKQAGRAS